MEINYLEKHCQLIIENSIIECYTKSSLSTFDLQFESCAVNELLVFIPLEIERRALCQLLKRRGLSPISIANVEELIEKIRFGIGDVVVIDLSSTTPLYHALNDFFELVHEIPVIILTPYDADQKELGRFRDKGYYVMVKPICTEELSNLIHRLLESTAE